MDATSFIAELGLSAVSLLLLLLVALVFSAYVKIVTVLGILRAGLGVGSLPSAFVVSGLALALSVLVMYPTLLDSSRAIDRALHGKGSFASDQERAAAFAAGIEKWRLFVKAHAGKTEVERFSVLARKIDSASSSADAARGVEQGEISEESDSWRVLAPAFLVSELKGAFATGLTLFLPFLVIDLVIASLLTSLSIDRLNPAIVALPFKLLLFVMLDGWTLITTNLVSTYL